MYSYLLLPVSNSYNVWAGVPGGDLSCNGIINSKDKQIAVCCMSVGGGGHVSVGGEVGGSHVRSL